MALGTKTYRDLVATWPPHYPKRSFLLLLNSFSTVKLVYRSEVVGRRKNLSLVALKIWVGNLHGNFFRLTFRLVLTTRKFRLMLWRQIFFFSLQPTCIDLSYLKCLSMLDSHKAVEKSFNYILFRVQRKSALQLA